MYLISDLDKTFLTNDFFLQQFLYQCLKNPLLLLKKGDENKWVNLKHKLLDSFFPSKPIIEKYINRYVLELLQRERENFKACLLISASTQKFLENLKSQSHTFDVFDRLHGTKSINLKGEKKLDFILKKKLTPYVYIGDSKSDEVLFKHAAYYYKIIDKRPIKCLPKN